MAYVQRPFSAYFWDAGGAVIDGAEYGPQPKRLTDDNFQYTFVAVLATTITVNNQRYRLTFDRWEYDSSSTFENWRSRITEDARHLLHVDGSDTEAVYESFYGGAPLTVTAYYTARRLNPGDQGWDDPYVVDPGPYTVTVSTDGHGQASGGGTFYAGETCTLWSAPFSNYSFRAWMEGSDDVSLDPYYSFTVTGNRDLVATFVPSAQWVVLETNYEDIGMIEYVGMALDRRAYVGQFAPGGSLEVEISGASHVSMFCFGPDNIVGGLAEGFEFDHWVAPNGGTPSSVALWLETSSIRSLSAYAQRRFISGVGYVNALVYKAIVKPKMSKVKIGFDPNGRYNQRGALKALRWNNGNIPWFEGTNPYDFASMVRVIKDTPTEYEAEIPYFVYATAAADNSYNFFPNFTRSGAYTYGFWRTFTEDAEVPDFDDYHWRCPPWVEDGNPRNSYWEYNLSIAVNELRAQINDFSPTRRLSHREYLELLFHIEPYDLGKLLCTGAGVMLCNSSGQLLYAG